MTSGPLEGVKVAEITMFQQGPVAGMRLGDLGAERSTTRSGGR
jgi:crotonobetainyl-CoA:carnitine CoA-transferase CaiB-like acyl-CoA transferase